MLCPCRWSFVICMVLAVASVQAVKAQPYTVSLEVRSESWVANSEFDRTDFTNQCSAAGVKLASADHGLVLVEYLETKGSEYGTFGFGGSGYGTNISYKLTLLSASDAKKLLSIESKSGTPSSVKSGANLNSDARSSFKQSPQYRYSCSMIAAALGSAKEAAKLLPWALQDREPLDLLERMHFAPSSAKESAFLAVAKGDFAGAEKLGADAAEPLAQFLGLYLDGQNRLISSGPEKRRAVARAVSALATVGDPTTSKIFVNMLTECKRWDRKSLASDDIIIASLHALGKHGDAFALSELESWSKEGDAVGQASTEAMEAIRGRLIRK